MKILFLGSESPECKKLSLFLHSVGEEVVFVTEKLTLQKIKEIKPEITISYNYHFILKPEIFNFSRLGTVNLHISYLPWNKGADPNFWSHIENTPKGVTIHYIDSGVDTGDIIGQESVIFSDADTLTSSYEKLHTTILCLFEKLWPQIRSGRALRYKQQGEGTLHRLQDKEHFKNLLAEKGYDILIKDLAVLHLNHKSIH